MEERNREQSIFISATKHKNVLAPDTEKVLIMGFVWFCSLVAFGNASNYKAVAGSLPGKACNSFCDVTIAFGVISFLYISVVLVLNYLCSTGSMSRYGFFSYKLEITLMAGLSLWWAFSIALSSLVQSNSPPVANSFSWLAFLGSVVASYKAYHAYKKADEPDVVPLNLDDGRYIYG